MTREVLIDLSARFPYGVIVRLDYKDGTIVTREIGIGSFHDMLFGNAEGKPYLRPMSSMTEDEFAEYEKAKDLDTLDSSETLIENMKAKHRVRISKWYHGTDWLNAHHFDYRGLIEKGLAIAITEENNPYK